MLKKVTYDWVFLYVQKMNVHFLSYTRKKQIMQQKQLIRVTYTGGLHSKYLG